MTTRWWRVLVASTLGMSVALAGCSGTPEPRSATCVGEGPVSVCRESDRSAPSLDVQGMAPGSTFTVTVAGDATSYTIADDGTLPGLLSLLSASGGAVQTTVSGTKADGTPYRDTIVVR